MLRKLLLAIYRGFFWTYERGSWQYDIMVICILIFVLLTPRDWFRDRPAIPPTPGDVILLLSYPAGKVYQLRGNLIHAQAGRTLVEDAQRFLRIYTGKPVQVLRVEPALDKQGQVVSYAVWVRE